MSHVVVLMGGASAEREISLQTGAGVVAALDSLGYRTTIIDPSDDLVDRLRAAKPDAVFNALHGGAGENGTIQALLDWMELGYQGSGMRASAVAMDKWMTKAVMRASDLPTPRAVVIDASDVPSTPPKRPGVPCVVKPLAEGSAVGVTIVRDESQWAGAVAAARSVADRMIVEAYVRGREFTVSVLGCDALPVVEIAPSDEFYSYHAKYTAGASRHTVPADLDVPIAARMQEYALRLHDALGCRDYSRIDVMMDATDESLYLLECNTLPGLTSLSLFPEAAAAAGIPYESLVERLTRCALSRQGISAR
ncbi:MAG TPA: D-alanine--D-alanine ligase [Candidatus Eremiobacteraceae bacterium]|nr:D-alanine--D-alanine ligase [Candidatus Eremiobacteraceae bacterium]